MTRDQPQSFRDELSGAVSRRTVLLVVGVLLVQVLFIASYVGAFHHPTPHGVPVDVVAPAPETTRLVSTLDATAGHPLAARAVGSEAAAAAAVRSDRTAGALVVSRRGSHDTILVAEGGGAALARGVTRSLSAIEAARGRAVRVDDLVPLQAGDYRGLSGFYLVIGWIVGGYLVAALLGIAAGSRPATTRRAVIRLGAIVAYALVSGLTGAVVVDQWLGALTGHFWALAGLGFLLVAAAAATTMAFQVLAGVIGIGITVLVFVVAGNPSAGGAYQLHLLPAFWRLISSGLPNGAGVDTVRRIVYFGGRGVTDHLLTICAWFVAGAAVAVVASRHHHRRGGLPADAVAAISASPAGTLRPH
ncbi:MAG TPA: hypothetical protein VFN60_08795 [Acidimicrobiales bacterium]|nr:hypothetical protein [Acidimicrobiales bacterium]